MLVLTRGKRKPDVVIALPDGREIVVTYLSYSKAQVHLGFTAPADVLIHRREIQEKIQRAKQTGGSER